MGNRIFFILIVLCFIGRSCAHGATAPANQITTKAQVKPQTTVKAQTKSNNYPALKTTLPPITQAPVAPAPTQPQPVDFGLCTKTYKLNKEKLFYLTLAGLNANKFEIKEIQSKSGYVVFSAAKKTFLASVIDVDSKTSMLKITPSNNVYFFPVGVVQNMFKYVDLNINTPIEKLSVL